MKQISNTVINVLLMSPVILIPIVVMVLNWGYKSLTYQDLDIISKYYTILVAFSAAYWGWQKWQEEKKRAKHEKNLINVDQPFISYLIRQETYRTFFMDGNNKTYTRDAMPIITSKITSADNHWHTDINVDRDNFTTLLRDADKSYMSLDLQKLINQYLLFLSIEKQHREEIIKQYKEGRVNERSCNSDIIDNNIKEILAGIYVNPNFNNAIRTLPIGQQYSELMNNIKKLDCEIIKRIIQEYEDDMDALNIKHGKITWDNLAKTEIGLSRVSQPNEAVEKLDNLGLVEAL